MKKTWFQYYQGHRISVSNWALHWPYLAKILLSRPKSVLELGCGPADHTVFLARVCPRLSISLLDKDEKLLSLLKKNFSARICSFYLVDLTEAGHLKRALGKKPKFDLMYSQGLMEHFSDQEFIRVIRSLWPFTKRMIFSVPSDLYPTRDFGNERLRSKGELISLLKKVDGIRFSVQGYAPDIGLRTKILVVRKNKLQGPEAVKLMLFGSCHWLIDLRPSS